MFGTGITGTGITGTGITGTVMFGIVMFVTGRVEIVIFGVVMLGFGGTLDPFPISTPYFPKLKSPNPKITPTAKTKSPIRPKIIQKNELQSFFLSIGSESATRSL